MKYTTEEELLKLTSKEALAKMRVAIYRPTEETAVINTENVLLDIISKDLEALEILSKYVSFKLYEQDSCYFIQVGNEPLKSITKEEYEILKRWKDGR